MKKNEPIYDAIGVDYAVTRCTDPDIATKLHAKLEGATRVLNVGAGTGSYEPDDVEVVAVEPSSEMIAQRRPDAAQVVQAYAEDLPFEDGSFSHVMTVLSMHHWSDHARAFGEINRVATKRFVAITCDPKAPPFWLVRDYFPEIYAMDLDIFPRISLFEEYFDDVKIEPLMIPERCQDGFLAAFWKRPHAYLDEKFRRGSSGFAKLQDASDGVHRLERDLASGEWARKNQEILNASSLDAGYRLVTAHIRRK